MAIDGAPNGAAGAPAISADGRVVAFESAAPNLVDNDGNGAPDVFRRDLAADQTILVSVTPDGDAARGQSRLPAISADGRMVAFQSTASDLLGPAASVPDAHLAAVATPRTEVYERDVVLGDTVLISVARNGRPGGNASLQPTVGGNGRYVAFASTADTLVRNDRLQHADVFLRDMPPSPRLNPGAIGFGSRTVGSPAAPAAATLVNAGWGPLSVRDAAITGAARGDFDVVADGCAGRVLHRQDACTVTRRVHAVAARVAPGHPRRARLVHGLAAHGEPARIRPAGPGRARSRAGHRSEGRAAGHRGRGDRAPGSRPTPTSASTGRWGSRPSSRPSGRTPAGGSASRCSCSTTTGSARATCARRRSRRARSRPCPRRCWSPDPSVGPPGFLIIRRVIDLPLVLLIRG